MVAPPPTRYGIPGQLQRKSAVPAARPAAVAPPPTRFGAPPVQAARAMVPVLQRFVPGGANNLDDNDFTRDRVKAGIEQAITALKPTLGFFSDADWDKVRKQDGAVFSWSKHDAIYMGGGGKRTWRKAGRIERHVEAYATGRILAGLTVLGSVFQVDGVDCTYKEQAVAEICGKLPAAQEREVGEAVRKIDTGAGVNNNTDISTIQSIDAIEDNGEKNKLKQAIAKLAGGQHASSGMGGNGCAIFFKSEGGKVVVTVLGHHYQNNAKKYEVVWAAKGYPSIKLKFPGA